jgi:mRNA-degrading endonuclease toxin of MazEF toxin-antitoxin module
MNRGDIFLANLNPSRGSEQAGIRPVVLVQNPKTSVDLHLGARKS